MGMKRKMGTPRPIRESDWPWWSAVSGPRGQHHHAACTGNKRRKNDGPKLVNLPEGHSVVRERVVVKSPVPENRPPGSVRGAPGNLRPYRDHHFSDFQKRACKTPQLAQNHCMIRIVIRIVLISKRIPTTMNHIPDQPSFFPGRRIPGKHRLTSVGCVLILLTVFLGCDPAKDFRSDINKISMGMSEHQLTGAIGLPDNELHGQYNGLSIIYRKQGSILQVYFLNDAVCGWAVEKQVGSDPTGRGYSMVAGEGRDNVGANLGVH